MTPFDLIVKGGHVIDPSQGIDGLHDVGIAKGHIKSVAPELPTAGCPDVCHVRGKYVCPGLVDLHGHWYEGGLYGIDANVCLNHGVTTAVDAGSAGFGNFRDFRQKTIEKSLVNLLAFIHISFLGLQAPFLEELVDIRYARPVETAETVLRNPRCAVGVKIRIGSMTGSHGIEALELALQAAKECRKPLMVHVSKGAPEAEVLRRLRPGDILTHCFHGRNNGMLAPDGAFVPAVAKARELGVVFDVGHGCGSFAWETAQKAFEHHFFPDTLSTDLHRYSVTEPLYISLPNVMSKFLCLGMSLSDVILKTTFAPAKVLGRENEIGTLRPGALADLLIFDLVSGVYEFTDTHLRIRKGQLGIVPNLVIKNGIAYESGKVPFQLRELYDFDRELLNQVASG